MLYSIIIEELKKAKTEIEHTIIKGQIPDYESYRFHIGRIQGLKDALDICHDTIKGNIEYDK